MNLYYLCILLLLLVLSAYSKGPQLSKPLDIHNYSVPVNSPVNYSIICAPLGVLALELPQNEVLRKNLPQNEVLQNKLPQNEVLRNITQKNDYILPKRVQNIVSKLISAVTLKVKSFGNLTSALIQGGRKMAWAIRITLECLQHVLHMYTWSLSENQGSINFRCKLTGLYLKQFLFRKHDFASMVNKLYQSVENSGAYDTFDLCAFIPYEKYIDHEVPEASSKIPSKFEYYGGGPSLIFSQDELLPYASTDLSEKQYKFLQCVKTEDKQTHISESAIFCAVPLSVISHKLTMKCIKNIASLHNMYMPSKIAVKNAQILLQDHICHHCGDFTCVFEPYKVLSNAQHQQNWYKRLDPDEKIAHLASKAKYKSSPDYQKHKREKQNADYQSKKEVKFPPPPPSEDLCQKIISGFCADTSPDIFEEIGCAVCGKLTPVCGMEDLSEVENINLLKADGVTRKARSKSSDPVKELRGPILAPGCSKVCPLCVQSLDKGNLPTLSLANGLWIGQIPEELQDLTYAEQLLIARVRHNRCIVKVSSGMRKMRANAISFSNPMPKIYNILPPPLEEMDEVLAFIYTGPCKPTKADFNRTPLLVRHIKVFKALHWLKLNHIDYYDCEISEKNLASYPEDGPPVVVDYRPSTSNKNPESTSVHDMEDEDGTEDGPCPFVVHGLTGEEFSNMTMKTIKAIALQHLTTEGKILGIGHAETPESIYGNPQLFPSMLPWLFPYGLGGIGQTEHKNKLSSMMHKRYLLMYHDKRFQKDPHFPLIAFNHEQIKKSTTAGYLTAERKTFTDITDRLMNVNLEVLSDLTKRMTDGERVKPETDEEKLCFNLINDLDHVNGHVPGSITQKKYMRNEIWSLISYFGAPSWFITFAPADNMHPICLYFADTQETFSPELRLEDKRYKLISENPVAGARFFHFMCEMFIKHVLGVGEKHPGLYGETSAYYGAVEQQGRLTLHLHMLLWILNSLSPQEIRDQIMDPTSEFQKKIVEYLESVHAGEFMTGTMDEVKAEVDKNMEDKEYKDPTQTLPDPPPEPTDCDCKTCVPCENTANWWQHFKCTVDD
jgi:hypothetical protein